MTLTAVDLVASVTALLDPIAAVHATDTGAVAAPEFTDVTETAI